MNETLIKRFWARVRKTPTCWVWTGTVGRYGYGHFYVGNRTLVLAHRFAYELLVGPIPEGLTLDHVSTSGCTSKACVKVLGDEHGPAHLEAVTTQENTRRYWAVYDTCRQGHRYDEANTYRYPSHGKRKCRACDRERKVLRLARRRAARGAA